MKAIIVIDMPSSCVMCEVRWSCKVYNKWKGFNDRLDGCPLKPLPEKKHGRLIDADAYLKKVCTYKETGCGSCKFQIVCPVDEPTINDCFDEIMGETE